MISCFDGALLCRRLLAGSAALAALAVPQIASASIIYEAPIYDTGTGFGNEPRLLTTQERGPRKDGTESACVGVRGGQTSVGSQNCISDSQVYKGNGVTNQGGDEVNPQREGNKYDTPTIGELGFNGAEDIGLIFNATEPSGNAVSIDDVTLKFYLDDRLLAAIDGSMAFDPTEAGNGVAGFLLSVDEEQQAYLNSTVFGLGDYSAVRLALETTISGIAGGPESFWATNLNRTPSSTGSTGSTGGTPVPAPAAFGLFALGALGIAAGRRRRTA
ncbi:PEP-CTERM sorting domain-containing protein [Sphingomonas parva]|uniref:PEP-CTERM sorting domain-containing protein n=1 Tax=Sphingomonas parva TaxID=2555898 RepID=A0A4Y8ZPE3_9SPHN|nr:PEP-CTERM sorting domain-containing protein [Sphingomonas parva]TFI57880.1 PEP-CTERM sorting domain-containing protein [Sphingomonas parva]